MSNALTTREKIRTIVEDKVASTIGSDDAYFIAMVVDRCTDALYAQFIGLRDAARAEQREILEALVGALEDISAQDDDGSLLIAENVGDILRIARPVLKRAAAIRAQGETLIGPYGEPNEVQPIRPDPALVERARTLIAEWLSARVSLVAWPIGTINVDTWQELAERIAAFAAEVASSRHYVCEAHVPLGEPGNHDDKCPCCEAMKSPIRRKASSRRPSARPRTRGRGCAPTKMPIASCNR